MCQMTRSSPLTVMAAFVTATLLRELLETTVWRCIAEGLVGCDGSATDGRLIRADIDFNDRPLVGLFATFHKTHRMSDNGMDLADLGAAYEAGELPSSDRRQGMSRTGLGPSETWSVEGGYGTTVSEMGPEEPVLSTVPTSTLRVIWFRSANSRTGRSLRAAREAGQMAASDNVPTAKNRLRLQGRPQIGKRKFVLSIGRSNERHSRRPTRTWGDS
jgi:hypothetical protein